MRAFRNLAVWTAAASAFVALPLETEGQVRRDPPADSGTTGAPVTVVPGSGYGAGSAARTILGAGWRDVWGTPVKVPVFDIGIFAGGLKIDKQGGGFQTVTLHMTEEKGWREYRFRSVDKFPGQRMPSSIRGTTLGAFFQDQTSTVFPAAPLLASPFVAAIDALHVEAKLYVMPDDPRLEAHRATFAGMLGTVELKGEEAPEDKPGFAGSSKIKDSDGFFEDFETSRAHRVDEREFLAVRLIDFLIGDADRGSDNYDWARFGDDGSYLWRPISRDRDRAFADARGLVNRLVVRPLNPKVVEFGPTIPLKGLTLQSYRFDRRLLQRLTAPDFEQVAARVQVAVHDTVIEAAINALPREWREQTSAADRLRTTLIARRALLPEVALRFYRQLAAEPDIYLTDDDERAEIVRHADGRVTVTVAGKAAPARIVAAAAVGEMPKPSGGATRIMNGSVDLATSEPPPFFQRTFLPAETNEIRVYLGKGDDVAVIRGGGAPTDAIVVRIIGGGGADVLADSAGGGATFLYDAEGENRFVTTRSTRVSLQPWIAPPHVSGFNPGKAWRPDWGRSAGWSGVIKHAEGAGVVVGVGPRFKSYGFRRLPHHWKGGANFLVGTGNGRVALTADADYRGENSPFGLTLAASASQLEAFRFYGYGNDTPDIGRDLSLVEQNVLAVEPALVWHIGWRAREGLGGMFEEEADVLPGLRPVVGRLHIGPILKWTDPQTRAGSPLAAAPVLGGTSFGHAGFRVGVELDATDRDPIPTSGWNLRANLAAYPPGLDLAETFTRATAAGAAYLPLGERGAHVAFRAAGALASGAFPAQYAPAIGGSSSLRGYRSRRFAGDASANAATELRLPVGTVNILVRSQLGVFGLADVGRVWFDGRGDGGWHTGLGGGVWLSALGQVVNFTYARGDEHRFYLKAGLAF
jgi:hypothetical protein